MKIIILHHHLKVGGVTSVISRQVQALESLRGYDICVMSGEEPTDSYNFGNKVEVEKLLNYMDFAREYSVEELSERLSSAISVLKSYIDDSTILHVHNISLGKNPVLSLAITELASQGMKVINHCHDFAEDRPANIEFFHAIVDKISNRDIHQVMYPDLPNYHYGVLTSSDKLRLKNIGIADEKIHFLPNPVVIRNFKSKSSDAKAEVFDFLGVKDLTRKFILYPVRAIRRKNIGEFVLLAALFEDIAEFAITLPPENPSEKELYTKWVRFTERLKSPNIHFEIGKKMPFETLMNAADFCLTTSIMEGFGMAYLEPWLFGKAIAGRNISSVTSDFKNLGISFPVLYDSLIIPAYKDYYDIDFALLEPDMQVEFIKQLKRNRSLKEVVLSANPQLEKLFSPVEPVIIKRNADIVKKEYSIQKYGVVLDETYRKIYQKFTTADAYSYGNIS